jgi:hypothetical protein
MASGQKIAGVLTGPAPRDQDNLQWRIIIQARIVVLEQ